MHTFPVACILLSLTILSLGTKRNQGYGFNWNVWHFVCMSVFYAVSGVFIEYVCEISVLIPHVLCKNPEKSVYSLKSSITFYSTMSAMKSMMAGVVIGDDQSLLSNKFC